MKLYYHKHLNSIEVGLLKRKIQDTIGFNFINHFNICSKIHFAILHEV